MCLDPTVPVIVPCRNEEPFIGVCLECLCSQTYPSTLLEIIVVNGRSTDSTRNIVMRYTSRDAEQEYGTKILPDKIRLAKHYVARPSLITDVLLTWRTMLITVCYVLPVKYCGIVEHR